MIEIRHCGVCRKYTLKGVCDCTIATAPVYPAKYSPLDKYAGYRRKAKEAERKAQGIV